jgi:transcriptional regulator with XRE-family HTH domain
MSTRRSVADMSPLGRFIYDRMIELKMSQKALAEKTGISANAIRSIQYGGRAKNETLAKLAQALEVPEDKLFRLYRGKPATCDDLFERVYHLLLSTTQLPPQEVGPVSYRLVQELESAYIF